MRWTQKECEILREYYPKYGIAVSSMLPGRTDTSIITKAKYMKLRVKDPKVGRSPSYAWTAEEVNILVSQYPKIGLGVRELLPDRTDKAILQKVCTLGLSESVAFWTEEEVELLRKLAGNLSLEQIAEKLGKKPMSVRNKIYRLGLTTQGGAWTSEEEAIIREYYTREGLDCIVRLPGRTVRALKSKAYRMGFQPEGKAPRKKSRYYSGRFSVTINGVECTTRKQVALQLRISVPKLNSLLSNQKRTMEDIIVACGGTLEGPLRPICSIKGEVQ